MKELIILGAGGLGQEIVLLIEAINFYKEQWIIKGFLDSHPSVQGIELLGFPVLGSFEDAYKFPNAHFIVAFGDPCMREKVVNLVNIYNINWATLISPTVRLHKSNELGKGVVIGRLSDLTVDAKISDHVIVNIHAVIGHGVEIGEYSVISPNVTITGGAKIGKSCFVGANAFIRDVTVGDYVTIGASSCVIKQIESNCVVAGVPARIIHQGPPVHSVTKILREKGEN